MFFCRLRFRRIWVVLGSSVIFLRIHFKPEFNQLGNEHLCVLGICDVLRLLENPQTTPARCVQNVLQLLLLGRPRLYLNCARYDLLKQRQQLLRCDIIVVEGFELDVLRDDIVDTLLPLFETYFVNPLNFVPGKSPNYTRQVLQVSRQQVFSGNTSDVHFELLPQDAAAGVVVQRPYWHV